MLFCISDGAAFQEFRTYILLFVSPVIVLNTPIAVIFYVNFRVDLDRSSFSLAICQNRKLLNRIYGQFWFSGFFTFWGQVRSSEIKWDQVRQCETKWDNVRPRETKWDQVCFQFVLLRKISFLLFLSISWCVSEAFSGLSGFWDMHLAGFVHLHRFGDHGPRVPFSDLLFLFWLWIR